MISPTGNKDLGYIPSHGVTQQINDRRLVDAETLTCIYLFQPSAAFHLETSEINDWFLFEMEHWADMG